MKKNFVIFIFSVMFNCNGMYFAKNNFKNLFAFLATFHSSSVEKEKNIELLVDEFISAGTIRKICAYNLEKLKDKNCTAKFFAEKFLEIFREQVVRVDSEDALLNALEFYHMLFSDLSVDCLSLTTQIYGLHRLGYLMVRKSVSEMPVEDSYCEEFSALVKDGVLEIVNQACPELNTTFLFPSCVPIERIELMQNGRLLIVGRSNGYIEVWRLHYDRDVAIDISLIHKISTVNHNNKQLKLQMFRDSYLAVGSMNKILIYDLFSGSLCWQASLSFNDKIRSMVWHSSGDLLISTDNGVQCFGLPRIQPFESIKNLLMKEFLIYLHSNGYDIERADAAIPNITLSTLPISYAYVWQDILNDFKSTIHDNSFECRQAHSFLSWPFYAVRSFVDQQKNKTFKTTGLILGLMVGLRYRNISKSANCFGSSRRLKIGDG